MVERLRLIWPDQVEVEGEFRIVVGWIELMGVEGIECET